MIINLCVPTASGVPLQLLPKEINGVRIIGIDVPGFGVPTHAEAKDVLAGAMLKYARGEAEQGRRRRARRRGARPTVTLLGEMFPADPVGIGMMLEPMGLAAGPVVPTREWRELYAALDCAAVAAIHPFYTAASARVRGRRPPWSASVPPVGHDGTEAWLQKRRRRPAGVGQRRRSTRPRTRLLPAIRGALAANPIKGPHHLSGYEGSELLVGAPAGRKRRRPALRRHRLPAHAVERGRPRMAGGARRAGAVPRLARAGPGRDARVPARPRDRHHAGGAEGQGAARSRAVLHQPDLGAPLMGPAGAGSLAQVVNAAIANKGASTR